MKAIEKQYDLWMDELTIVLDTYHNGQKEAHYCMLYGEQMAIYSGVFFAVAIQI